ncbi:MAG: hypothetical protein KAH18_01205 [Psychromonas sp.]|nr:hypothetical protein [Psychromonas sp.]
MGSLFNQPLYLSMILQIALPALSRTSEQAVTAGQSTISDANRLTVALTDLY